MRTLTLILLLCISSYSLTAQAGQIENLVFEGAGIRGIAYSGVIRELEREGIMDQVQRVGGTSAGAITALALSVGYTSDEIYALISGTNFGKFNDGLFSRLNGKYGLYEGDRFERWIGEIIAAKTGRPDITFRELRESGYRDLRVTATCLNRQQLLVFSADTYPDMRVRDAVRISMSIPLYFEAVFIDEQGGVYKKPGRNQDLDLVVDGGIIGNYPIFIFDSTIVDSAGHERRIPNRKTLGVRIDTETQIESDLEQQGLAPMKIGSMTDYVEALYNIVIESLNRNILIPEDWDRTISVSSAGIGPRIKKLSAGEKRALIESGEKHTRAFLDNFGKQER